MTDLARPHGRRPSPVEAVPVPAGFDPADPYVCAFRVAGWCLIAAPDLAAFDAARAAVQPSIAAAARGHPALGAALAALAERRRTAFAAAASQGRGAAAGARP